MLSAAAGKGQDSKTKTETSGAGTSAYVQHRQNVSGVLVSISATSLQLRMRADARQAGAKVPQAGTKIVIFVISPDTKVLAVHTGDTIVVTYVVDQSRKLARMVQEANGGAPGFRGTPADAGGVSSVSPAMMRGPHDSGVTTEVKDGTVVYVSGNDLVVRRSDGSVEHFVVPESQKFNVDGKEVSVNELKPGIHLTAQVTTTSAPKMVTTTRTIDGKVWYVNAPNTVILTLPDGMNKVYRVPRGQMFMIDGKEQSVFHLKKGMNVSAQVVTEEPFTEASRKETVNGVAPPPLSVPDNVSVLLVEQNSSPPAAAAAAPEPAPATLPKTGSEWPLFGLIGLGSLAAGILTRRLRLGLK
jgi:LPXTG-motif cell wall-anchored protein